MCGQENADYSFLVDASGSILSDEFAKLKQFINGVVDYLSIGRALTHVGLIEYSGSAKMQFSFNTSYDKEDIKKRVDDVPHTAGITRIDLALKVASEELFTEESGMRQNSRKVKYVTKGQISIITYCMVMCFNSVVLQLFCLEPCQVKLPFLPNFKLFCVSTI